MRFCLGALFLLVFFAYPSNVYAVSISIDEYPKEINAQEFNVKFTVAGAKSGINYFRLLLRKDGSKTSDALTWNGSDWYGGSDGEQYFPSQVTSKTEATLKAKLNERATSGDYLLSIQRYTASGNQADDSQTPVTVKVIALAQTDTPESVPQVVVQTGIPKVEEKMEVEQVVAKPAQILVPDSAVLSEVSELAIASPISTPVNPIEESQKESSSSVPKLVATFIFILLGIGFTTYGGFVFWKRYQSWYTEKHAYEN